MTIPRNPRSLHRLSDSRIADMVRTYALQWDQGQLADDAALAAVALKMIHKARRIDAETRREIEAMGAQRAGEAAERHSDDFRHSDTQETTCPSDGPLSGSAGYAQNCAGVPE